MQWEFLEGFNVRRWVLTSEDSDWGTEERKGNLLFTLDTLTDT